MEIRRGCVQVQGAVGPPRVLTVCMKLHNMKMGHEKLIVWRLLQFWRNRHAQKTLDNLIPALKKKTGISMSEFSCADWQHSQEWCWWWTGWYYSSEQSSVTDRLCRGALSTKHVGGIQNTKSMMQRCTLRIMFTQQHISESGNQVVITVKGAYRKAWHQSAGLFVCMFMLISSILMGLIL